MTLKALESKPAAVLENPHFIPAQTLREKILDMLGKEGRLVETLRRFHGDRLRQLEADHSRHTDRARWAAESAKPHFDTLEKARKVFNASDCALIQQVALLWSTANQRAAYFSYEAIQKCSEREAELLGDLLADEMRFRDWFEEDAEKQELAGVRAEIKELEQALAAANADFDRAELQLKPIRDALEANRRDQKACAHDLTVAQEFCARLEASKTPRDRALIHQECEERFASGKPGELVSSIRTKLKALARVGEKLLARGNGAMLRVNRTIKRLVFDGNNFCYRDGEFIGLTALISVIPALTSTFDVTVVFDASIRRQLQLRDADIAQKLLPAKTHVVASKQKADKTVLECATDPGVFVVSNDTFREFPDCSAVSGGRVIRHEIVRGRVIIDDLVINVQLPDAGTPKTG